MGIFRLLSNWFRGKNAGRPARRHLPSYSRFVAGRVLVEQLEDRRLMAALTEFPIPTGDCDDPDECEIDLGGIAPGPDGNIWFTEEGTRKIGRITPQGQLTEFSDGITQIPVSIVAGPDGNLWFTEQFGLIGRITPAGAVTEFALGDNGGLISAPFGIAAGADGNLWFTDLQSVGRITPQGEVTRFSDGLSFASVPADIVSGPDGNLWFTDDDGSIGRITPAGIITEFELAENPATVIPGLITPGPDGNVWFTESNLDRIGRITPDGVITVFAADISPDSAPTGITTGPDGNLWFIETFGERIGRITVSGEVTEFTPGITPDSFPIQITAGPDGNIWFAEFAAGVIGRFELPSADITPNVAPSFVSGPDQSTTDESGLQSIPGWATEISSGPPSEAGQALQFIVVGGTAPELFAVPPAIDASGTLTFTPAPNVHGTSHITIRLMDDGGTANDGADTSAAQTFDITIDKPHPLHNTASALDVTGDGFVAPIDALTVINLLNAFGPGAIPSNVDDGPPFYDENNDGFIAPIDALDIINALNSNQLISGLEAIDIANAIQPATAATGGRAPDPQIAQLSTGLAPGSSANLDVLISLLAADVGAQTHRRR